MSAHGKAAGTRRGRFSNKDFLRLLVVAGVYTNRPITGACGIEGGVETRSRFDYSNSLVLRHELVKPRNLSWLGVS